MFLNYLPLQTSFRHTPHPDNITLIYLDDLYLHFVA